VTATSSTYTKISYNVPVTLTTTGKGKHKKTKPAHLTARAVARARVLLAMTIVPYVKPTPKPTPTPTPTPAPIAPPAPAGPPYVGTGPYTTPVYDTTNGTGGGSFSGTGLPEGWSTQQGAGECDPGAINYNTGGTANAADDGNGDLVITAKNETISPGDGHTYSWTSAQLISQAAFSHGAVEASIKMPKGAGGCSAFWLLAQNHSDGNDPGELDVIEAPAFGDGPQNPNFEDFPFYAIFTLHGDSAPGADDDVQQFETYTNAVGDMSLGFHTYGIVWSPTSIIWTIDGYEYASATPSTISGNWDYANQNFNLILDFAVGGWPCAKQGGGTYLNCPSATVNNAQMVVQWVKVFQ
jgi:beta-glucanase (GH16 family)